MNKKLWVFDFDGTIADSFSHFLKILDDLADEFRFRKIGDLDKAEIRNQTSEELIRTLKIPKARVPFIVARAIAELHNQIAQIKPVFGIREVLTQLKSVGYQMGILTTNSAENVMAFLENNDMDSFDFVSSSTSLWGKKSRLKRLFKNREVRLGDAFYIGDETRDILAAKNTGVKVSTLR